MAEAPGDGCLLHPYNPELERQMSLAEEMMHENRDILFAFAK